MKGLRLRLKVLEMEQTLELEKQCTAQFQQASPAQGTQLKLAWSTNYDPMDRYSVARQEIANFFTKVKNARDVGERGGSEYDRFRQG